MADERHDQRHDQRPVLLKAEGINQYYGGSHILRNVGFEAKQGEVTVVLGRNGVGKTTLLKSLMGVVPVKAGTVQLDGADITRATSYDRVRRGIDASLVALAAHVRRSLGR